MVTQKGQNIPGARLQDLMVHRNVMKTKDYLVSKGNRLA